MYCPKCKKEVIIVGEGSSAGMDEEIDEWEEKMAKEGKILLYNPPLSSSYFCPICKSELVEKKD